MSNSNKAGQNEPNDDGTKNPNHEYDGGFGDPQPPSPGKKVRVGDEDDVSPCPVIEDAHFEEYLKVWSKPTNPESAKSQAARSFSNVYSWCYWQTERIATKLGYPFDDALVQDKAIDLQLKWMATTSRNNGESCKGLFLQYIKNKLFTAARRRRTDPIVDEPTGNDQDPKMLDVLDELIHTLARIESAVLRSPNLPVGTWLADQLSESPSPDLWDRCDSLLGERILRTAVGKRVKWLNLKRWLAATAGRVTEPIEADRIKSKEARRSPRLTHKEIVGALNYYAKSMLNLRTSISENRWAKWVSRAKVEVGELIKKLKGGSGGIDPQST